MSKASSYVAAGQIPWKMLRLADGLVKDGIVQPRHIQLIPTNRCNMDCSWCSCSKVDRQVEMPLEEVVEVVDHFAKLGANAVTITGGGEPSVHRHIEPIVLACAARGYKIGMVTNGVRWGRTTDSVEYLNRSLTWLRLSVYDTEGSSYKTCLLKDLSAKLPDVDIGLSFTVTSKVNLNTAIIVCRLAEKLKNVTHVRFVHDILAPDEDALRLVEMSCANITPKAIFQDRSRFTAGTKDCLISRLKPVIDATGFVYPCCGVQYATSDTKHMPECFRMCHWRAFEAVQPFDGSGCQKCYYEAYNTALSHLTSPFHHKDFI